MVQTLLLANKITKMEDYLEYAIKAFHWFLGRNSLNHVVYDESFTRPAEVDILVGDATKAKDKLGWVPSVKFDELVGLMVDSDLANT